MRRHGLPGPLLFVAVAVAVCGTLAMAEELADGRRGLLEVLRLDDGTVVQVEEFVGPSKATALPHLFTNSRVEVSCPSQKDFSVFTGSSMHDVRAAYARNDRAWCGLAHLLNDSPNCTVAISPYGSTYVAVAKPKTWLSGGTESHSCLLERQEALSTARLLAAVLGAFLFWNAGVLSESTPFRLTGGTLGVMALSSIILLFILYRKVPHKGKLLAGTAVFGSSFLAYVRWLFGTWLPSLHEVLRHPVTIAYLALSGLTGLGVTYYYNNTGNTKVNTMLRVALQLVGLASVYLSASMNEASLGLCAALLGAKGWDFVKRHHSLRSALASAKHGVQEQLGTVEEVAEEAADAVAAAGRAGGRGVAAAARHAAHPASPAAPARGGGLARTPVAAVGVQEPEVSPLIQRGLVLNEETGHIIGIGKGTYNRLVESGYVVDHKAGTITPPPPSPRSPGRTSGGGRRRRVS